MIDVNRPKIEKLIEKIKYFFPDEYPIPLHRPVFGQIEINNLIEVLKSSFVSSVGDQIGEFERTVADFVNVKHAIAVTNGTSALHLSLLAAGVSKGDEVITQALTFVATVNAVSYCGASPVFLDVDKTTLGLSAVNLKKWLDSNVLMDNGVPRNIFTKARIGACLPMHTFGFPCEIEEINAVCRDFNIPVIEDAAEALGSYKNGKHVGTSSLIGTLSFNGNKIITTGGGGMVLTNCDHLCRKIRHLSTTAKVSHSYQFTHDELGYNYRLPNLNAALGLAQFQRLPDIMRQKKNLFSEYKKFCDENDFRISRPPVNSDPNYWLINIICESKDEQFEILEYSIAHGVLCRPPWKLMIDLPMYNHCQHDELSVSKYVADHFVSVPSSCIIKGK